MWPKIFLLLVLSCITNCVGYKILAVFTHPGKSHFHSFRPLLEGLVKRGHQITLVSLFDLNVPITNYTHVNLENPYPSFMHMFDLHQLYGKDFLKVMYEPIYLNEIAVKVCENSLNSVPVQKLFNSNESYDLIILEYFNSFCDLAYVLKFKAPFIALSSCLPLSWTSGYLGNPNNPSYIPNVLSPYTDKMSFFERTKNFIITTWTSAVHLYYSDYVIYSIVKKQFNVDLPLLSDVGRNISLLITNTHFTVIRPKPAVPTVIDLQGMHISTPKQLPKVISN